MARTGKGSGKAKAGTKRSSAKPAAAPASSPDTISAKIEPKAPRNEKGQLLPGSVLNPVGRPKGARHKLAEDFIAKLAADFKEHGVTAIESVRKDEPAQYLRVVSSLVPKAFDLGEDDDGNQIAGVALITRGAIDAIIERGRSDG